MSRNDCRSWNEYAARSASTLGYGSDTPCFAARSNTISGSSVPSMWRCNSTLGIAWMRRARSGEIEGMARRGLCYGPAPFVEKTMSETAITPDFDPVPTIASELGLPPAGVRAVVDLLAEGNTVPFIARYRKERTGALDEVQ